ncbi:MAG: hypothetical protein JKY54_04105 [Flavobacteriales bacterium]|nr:hypothetical protein [Flavobacteriales bacterium]
MRKFLVVLVFCLGGFSYAQENNLLIGLTVSPSFHIPGSFEGEANNTPATFDMKMGFYTGFQVGWRFTSRWTVRLTSAIYQRRHEVSYDWPSYYTVTPEDPISSFTKASFISSSLQFTRWIIGSDEFSLGLNMGGFLEILMNTKEVSEFNDGQKKESTFLNIPPPLLLGQFHLSLIGEIKIASKQILSIEPYIRIKKSIEAYFIGITPATYGLSIGYNFRF